jgi:hypothetical protein
MNNAALKQICSVIGVVFLTCVPALPALGWGVDGHYVVAEVAQRNLYPTTKAQIANLIGAGKSLASVAVEPDNLVSKRPDTLRWHFVNIPFDERNYDPARDCRQQSSGDCIVAAIERFRQVLQDESSANAERAEAVIFLTHLVADIHQPLHCIDQDGDKGGLERNVIFFGENISLHLLWDFGIIERWNRDWGALVTELERNQANQNQASLLGGEQVTSWALESHGAAMDVAYALPANSDAGEDYYLKSLAVIQSRLWLAGMRLAHMLNILLGQDANPG